MDGQKTDFPVATMREFGLHTFGYVGRDETFLTEMMTAVGDHPIRGAEVGEKADVVFLDVYGSDPVAVINAALNQAREGGFVMGSLFDHSEEGIRVQRALADRFNLMGVQVGPCGVWGVRKQ